MHMLEHIHTNQQNFKFYTLLRVGSVLISGIPRAFVIKYADIMRKPLQTVWLNITCPKTLWENGK